MAQPQPPNTRQSGPEAKPAPKKGTLHDLKPGGPIKPTKQGYVNPGPTDNLRGVEPNTSMHRGTPNPAQSGTPGMHGDHSPGYNSDTHAPTPPPGVPLGARHSTAGKKMGPQPPNPKGVRK